MIEADLSNSSERLNLRMAWGLIIKRSSVIWIAVIQCNKAAYNY